MPIPRLLPAYSIPSVRCRSIFFPLLSIALLDFRRRKGGNGNGRWLLRPNAPVAGISMVKYEEEIEYAWDKIIFLCLLIALPPYYAWTGRIGYGWKENECKWEIVRMFWSIPICAARALSRHSKHHWQCNVTCMWSISAGPVARQSPMLRQRVMWHHKDHRAI